MHSEHIFANAGRLEDGCDGQHEVVERCQTWHLQALVDLVSMGSMTDHTSPAQNLADIMDPARGRAMQVALGLSPTIEAGDVLPPFFHHLYFWDPQPPESLGLDGHPALGGFVPDMGPENSRPKRMWAAGRLLFHAGLKAGIKAEKTSVVEGVTRKTGRSGPLAFVRLRHDIRQRGTVAVSEWQDIVYRSGEGEPTVPPAAREDEVHSEIVDFDTTLLFRYSALTMNGHRIHYDRPYAKGKERYDNLVVHGPLLAQHLMLLGERMLGKPLTEVSYRATSPLTLPHSATLCWADGRAWVRGPNGEQCMEAVIR